MKLMALLVLVLSTFTPGHAEIMVGYSAEWVAHESDLIILATPLEVENFKGPGEVRFTKTRFRVDEIIKGGASAGDTVTIFDYSYNQQDVLGLEQAKLETRQLLIYAKIAANTFTETDGRYIFTHTHDFKSAYHAALPVNKLFTPELKPLISFAETLERTRKQVAHDTNPPSFTTL